jgi:predicted dehydrogenase
VAIIGCGRMGRVRASACRALGADVVAVVDRDAAAAASLAAAFPDALGSHAIEELDWRAVDAAVVCTPPAERTTPVLAAIEAGVPVLVEKPVGVSAAAAEAIARELRRKPVLAAVGYMNRQRPSVQRLRAELLGREVFAVVGRWVAPAYEKPWWVEAEGGGALRDYATHLVDLFRYVVGEIGEVLAIGGAGADVAAVAVRFRSGAIGSLVTSSLGEEKHIDLDVFFRGGSERLEGWDLRSTRGRPGEDDPFVDETRLFLEAVRGRDDGRRLCTFADALRTQLAVDAIARALASGRVERVGDGAVAAGAGR